MLFIWLLIKVIIFAGYIITMLSTFIDSHLFGYLFPFLLIGFILFGYYMARKREKKAGKAAKLSGMEGSVISFFALLISFTLASAGSSMKDRLNLIHSESDGLAQLYRSSVFLGDSSRAAVNEFIIRHIEIQLDDKQFSDASNDLVIAKISANGGEFLKKISDQKEMSTILQSFNSLTSSTIKLLYSYEERMPKIVMILLVISSLLIGALIGFMNGSTEERHYLAPFIYAILVVITIQAIRDLDNPAVGTVKPSFSNLSAIRSIVAGK